MEEIARQFCEELQELLDRYKNRLTNPQIMHIAQPVFTKTIGFKDNPERLERIFNNAVHNLPIAETLRCPSQMIAEADCDGDIKKCGRACFEGEWICTN